VTAVSLLPLASLPSPDTSVWRLGPLPIRAYALCIVLGIVIACVVTDRRLRRRGVAPGVILDIAVWAVPFGIVGARIYHVVTSPQQYFGAGGHPLDAFKIWQGGLGIWGAVAGGALGAWIAARQLGIPLSVVADALAPGLPLAQAVGRFGNWFNNELYGGPTTLPWGLQVHRMDPYDPGHAVRDASGRAELLPGLYHPTFAYEALWNVGVAVLVLLADRRFRLGKGRAFALYVMGYTAGRFWIEIMRSDEANRILGVRLNVFTAALVFLGALVYFLRVRGPRDYLVPVAAAGTPAPGGDVSQVDVSAPAAPPSGYRVVTEEQFLAYRRTGELPSADDAARADGEPDDRPGPGSGAPGGDDRSDVPATVAPGAGTGAAGSSDPPAAVAPAATGRAADRAGVPADDAEADRSTGPER
jgi:prolipoprotein diacylglyceryl transferase